MADVYDDNPLMNNEEQVDEQSSIDPRLQSARDQRDKLQLYGNLLSGFQDIVGGATGFKGSKAAADALRAQGQQRVSDYTADRQSELKAKQEQRAEEVFELSKAQHEQSAKTAKLKAAKMGIDLKNEQDLDDPANELIPYVRKDLQGKLNKRAEELKQEADILPEDLTLRQLNSLDDFVDTKKGGLSEYQQLSLALREKELKLRTGKEGRLAQGQKFKQEEKQEISDKQTEQLQGYDEALSLLKDAEGFKKNVDTGFLTNVSDSMRTFIGKQDPDVSDLKMAIGETLVKKVKALSGTAASDKEREMIQEVSLPSINDDDNVFNSKLNRAIKTLEKAKKNSIDAYKKQGKDPSAFEEKSKSAAPKGKKVIQNGNIFEIDENGNAKFIGKAE